MSVRIALWGSEKSPISTLRTDRLFLRYHNCFDGGPLRGFLGMAHNRRDICGHLKFNIERKGNPCLYESTPKRQTSLRRQRKATSTSMNGSATVGRFCFPTPRTSLPSAPPSSVTWPD